MNREIKFRAWHAEAGQMLYPEKQWHLFSWGEDEKQPIEIMQYTGLKDKNGTEIYEGDIVAHEDFYPSNVHFVAGSFYFWDLPVTDTPREGWEVIGNIYENPSLLENSEV